MFVFILNEMNWDELYQLQNKIIINFKFIISGVFNSSVHAKLVEVSEDEENDEKIVTKYVGDDDDDEPNDVEHGHDVDDDGDCHRQREVFDDEDEEDCYIRKTSAVNNLDNGIGLDTISEDSCHNDDDESS